MAEMDFRDNFRAKSWEVLGEVDAGGGGCTGRFREDSLWKACPKVAIVQ